MLIGEEITRDIIRDIVVAAPLRCCGSELRTENVEVSYYCYYNGVWQIQSKCRECSTVYSGSIDLFGPSLDEARLKVLGDRTFNEEVEIREFQDLNESIPPNYEELLPQILQIYGWSQV